MGLIDAEALKASVDLVSVVASFVALKKRGAEYVGLCVSHDEKTPSMCVMPQDGKRYVYCHGCGFSADVIGFVQHMKGIGFKEACEWLGAKPELPPLAPVEHYGAERARPDRTTSKPPADAGVPRMHMRELGDPSLTWCYVDTDGAPIMYVGRYETASGKEYRPFTWGRRGDDAPAWGSGHYNRGERPLYRLDQLAARPEAPVMLTEGEKDADAAQALLPQYVVTTWAGGAKAWKHTDFGPLRGRRVDLFGDNDEPGRKAVKDISLLLRDGLGCHGKIIDGSELPEGGGAADLQAPDIMGWLRPRSTEYASQTPAPPVAADPPTASASTPEPEGAGPAESDAPPEPPPPIDFPEEAQEARPAKPQRRKRGHLTAVDGTGALAPQPDAEPEAAPLSHDALAEHFVAAHHEDWRYVAQWGKWFQWHDDRWQEDVTERPVGLAKMTTRASLYWPEAAGLTSDGRRKVNSIMTAKALLGFARADEKIAARVDQWDKEPWLLGVPGGVLELQSGKMLEAVRTQYITKQCAIAPAGGKPTRWLDFLARVTDDNPNMIAFLHRSAGYWLTGVTREHSLTFLYGTGANGKSVFMRTLGGILGLGEYARSCQMTVFTESKLERHSTDLAELRGARLVMAEETGGGAKWDQAKIQWLTGEGAVTARFMRMDNFTYQPMFKLLFAGNHKPKLTSVDEAIRRRFHLVPFTVTIPPEERDSELFEKLREEWPQILGWMLDGCAEWQRIGLAAPAEVREATDTYLETEDAIGQWMDECCERKDRAFGSTLYESYRRWCEKVGEHPWTRRAWSNALIERGFQNKKGTDNAPMFLGLRLRDGANLP